MAGNEDKPAEKMQIDESETETKPSLPSSSSIASVQDGEQSVKLEDVSENPTLLLPIDRIKKGQLFGPFDRNQIRFWIYLQLGKYQDNLAEKLGSEPDLLKLFQSIQMAESTDIQNLELIGKNHKLYFQAMHTIDLEARRLENDTIGPLKSPFYAWFGRELTSMLSRPAVKVHETNGNEGYYCTRCNRDFINLRFAIMHMNFECGFRFERIPHLCMKKIFEFLSVRDLVRCRAVNKRFKFYADGAQVIELAVSGRKDSFRVLCHERLCRYFYLTGRPINLENSISWNSFHLTPFRLDEQLKYLHIHLTGAFDLEILNRLKRLVHLEVKSLAGSYESELILTELQLLDLRYCYLPCVLKTPKLEVLAVNKMEIIQVNYPETIKRLECDYRNENQMATFKNLEILCCEFKGDQLRGPILISQWKALKELNLRLNRTHFSVAEYEQFKGLVSSIVSQREESKRTELKVYLREVLFVHPNQLRDFYTKPQNDFLFTNYKLLRPGFYYPGVNKVHFNELMRLDFELSIDFFKTFTRIQELTATGLVSRDDFGWFLRNTKALRCLTLINPSLDQTFMDDLPNLSKQLTRLEVNESWDLITNFNFILRFKMLEEFRTDRRLASLDLIEKAFQQLKKLSSFQFRVVVNEVVKINRPTITQNAYTLSFYSISNNQIGVKLLEQMNLSWEALVDVYDQRIAEGSRTVARIKRARLK